MSLLIFRKTIADSFSTCWKIIIPFLHLFLVIAIFVESNLEIVDAC